MLYLLTWSVMLVLLVLWSLAAWAIHAIAAWTVSNVDAVAVGAGTGAGMRTPDWLTPWIPPELGLAFTSMLSGLSPAIEAALELVPALAGGLTVATWAVWGIGSVLIFVLGLLCSRLVTMLRRRSPAHSSGILKWTP